MRTTFITILLLLITISLTAVNIEIRGTSEKHNVPEIQIDGINYISIKDLGPALKCISKQERLDQRLYLHFFGETFIFLEGSSYYSYKIDSYNMHFPLQRKGANYYLPTVFLTEHLPLHFEQEAGYKRGVLSIKQPVDHSVQVIVLDPGHGGKDPGAVGKALKIKEKDVNLAVALKLKTLLEKELGVKVLMTRPDDRFVSLQDRTRFANENKANLFISIHANSSTNISPRGAETYYLATAMTSDARAVEALENKVVELYEGGASARSKYDGLDFILSDLSQTEHLQSSNELASSVQQNLIAGCQAYDRGVKQANFYVLKGAFMPSILIELGFLSNPDEERLLVNDDYQQRLARTIFEGLKRFKYRYDRIRNT
ncbi:MAG: N-acetylmuramoyl-L-alanine amidase [Candidatus Cloacimonetes bacterium]|nr:N-acetylmuramoyl-L-alanine amidase [Candidatus Cloacimonadota bacterium]